MNDTAQRPARVTLSAEEYVVLIREIPTDFPCLKDSPCEDASNPADRSESLAHHFDCPTLDAWAVVKRILAAREQALREEIAGQIEAKYLGPDSGRSYDGREAPDAALRNAYDEGLESAARIARGETR